MDRGLEMERSSRDPVTPKPIEDEILPPLEVDSVGRRVGTLDAEDVLDPGCCLCPVALRLGVLVKA